MCGASAFMTERQAQLPRARVEVRQGVAKNVKTVVESNASRLGVHRI